MDTIQPKIFEQDGVTIFRELQNESIKVKQELIDSLNSELEVEERLRASYNNMERVAIIKDAVNKFGNPRTYEKIAREILDNLKGVNTLRESVFALRTFLDLGVLDNGDEYLRDIMMRMEWKRNGLKEYIEIFGRLIEGGFIQNDKKINQKLDELLNNKNTEGKISYLTLLRFAIMGGFNVSKEQKFQAYKIAKDLRLNYASPDNLIAVARAMAVIGSPFERKRSLEYLASIDRESYENLESFDDIKAEESLVDKGGKIGKYRKFINELISENPADKTYIYLTISSILKKGESLSDTFEKRFNEYKNIKQKFLEQTDKWSKKEWNKEDQRNIVMLQNTFGEQIISLNLTRDRKPPLLLDVKQLLDIYTKPLQQHNVNLAVREFLEENEGSNTSLPKILLMAHAYISLGEEQLFIDSLKCEDFQENLNRNLLACINKECYMQLNAKDVLFESWYENYLVNLAIGYGGIKANEVAFLKSMIDKFVKDKTRQEHPDIVETMRINFERLYSEKDDRMTEEYIRQKFDMLNKILDSQKKTSKFRIWILVRIKHSGKHFSNKEELRLKHNIIEVESIFSDKVGDRYERQFEEDYPDDFQYNIIYEGKEFKYELDGYNSQKNQALEIKSHFKKVDAAIKNGLEKALMLFRDTDIDSVRIVAYSEEEESVDFTVEKKFGGLVITNVMVEDYDEYDDSIMRRVSGNEKVDYQSHILDLLEQPILTFSYYNEYDREMREIEYIFTDLFDKEGNENNPESSKIKYPNIKSKVDDLFERVIKLKDDLMDN